MKTYQHGYYSICLCFDSMLSYNTSMQNNDFMKRRQQNQKFPSFQMFRFAAGGVGGATIKNDRKFFGFAPREQGARGRGACLRRGFGRQASVIRQNPADFVRNTFELRPIHTARIENRNWKPKWGRAEGATPLCPFLLIPNFGGEGGISASLVLLARGSANVPPGTLAGAHLSSWTRLRCCPFESHYFR